MPAQLITPVVQQPPPKFVVQTQDVKLAPIQAIPAFAKIQNPPSVVIENPQHENVVQFQNLQAYPVGYFSQNTVLTPYSASFVQIYQ